MHSYKVATTIIASNLPLNRSFDRFLFPTYENTSPTLRVHIVDTGPRYRYDDSKNTCFIHRVFWEKRSSLNEPIKTALNPFLLKHDAGFFLHSSFLNSSDFSCLITGVSGSGKSTLTKKLASFFRCGNDDLNIVHPQRELLTVHSTPFCNWEKIDRRELPFPVTADIKNIYILEKEKNSKSSVERISDGDVLWSHLFDKRQIILPQIEVRYTKILNKYIAALLDSGKFFFLRHNLNDPAEYLHELIVTAH